LLTKELEKEVSMPHWLISTLDVLQLLVNVGALIGGAIIWKLYVNNLKAALTAKDSAISSVEKNRDMWRDKAQDLEKRSPEFMKRTLSERIQTRENEMFRLTEDKGRNEEELKVLHREKADLENDLIRSQGFRLMLDLEEGSDDQDKEVEEADPAELYQSQTTEIQVVLLGEVGVDSGLLMITDPSYIDTEWQHTLDSEGTDETAFDHSTIHIKNDMVKTGAHPIQPYSYEGIMAVMMKENYGELAYKMGHAGAGVAFSTGWGDGIYPVYGELHDGRILRVFITTG